MTNNPNQEHVVLTIGPDDVAEWLDDKELAKTVTPQHMAIAAKHMSQYLNEEESDLIRRAFIEGIAFAVRQASVSPQKTT